MAGSGLLAGTSSPEVSASKRPVKPSPARIVVIWAIAELEARPTRNPAPRQARASSIAPGIGVTPSARTSRAAGRGLVADGAAGEGAAEVGRARAVEHGDVRVVVPDVEVEHGEVGQLAGRQRAEPVVERQRARPLGGGDAEQPPGERALV